MPANGLGFGGPHHEIYLSDARKVAPEKLKEPSCASPCGGSEPSTGGGWRVVAGQAPDGLVRLGGVAELSDDYEIRRFDAASKDEPGYRRSGNVGQGGSFRLP